MTKIKIVLNSIRARNKVDGYVVTINFRQDSRSKQTTISFVIFFRFYLVCFLVVCLSNLISESQDENFLKYKFLRKKKQQQQNFSTITPV